MNVGWLPLGLLAVACYSPGPYGYSRVYSPLDAEESAAETAREYDPVMAQRAPADWKKGAVSVFGIVKNRNDASGGQAYLTLGIRTLADRNLCDDADEASCRVTVGEREHAVIHAQLKLLGEDDLGRRRVEPGSLVRVIGRLRDDLDKDDGAPVISADYYRHFPRGEYVTRGDSEHMRR